METRSQPYGLLPKAILARAQIYIFTNFRMKERNSGAFHCLSSGSVRKGISLLFTKTKTFREKLSVFCLQSKTKTVREKLSVFCLQSKTKTFRAKLSVFCLQSKTKTLREKLSVFCRQTKTKIFRASVYNQRQRHSEKSYRRY